MARGFNGGLARLNRKMTRTIPQKAKAAAVQAVIVGAYEVANLQYGLAPEDDGDLRKSIEVTEPGKATPPGGVAGDGVIVAREGQAIITAGNDKVTYAHIVEYGSPPHIAGGMFAGALIPAIPAQPYFWPGWRALRRRVKSRITSAINKAVKAGAR